VLSVLSDIAVGAGIALPELSLAWLLSREGVSALLCGARKPVEIEQSTRALDVEVPETIFTALTNATESVKTEIGDNPDMWMGSEESRYI
jgi:aryl-alcohol dehydrogenase-like predicted oxidoreductase